MKLLGQDEKAAKPQVKAGPTGVDTLIGSHTEIRGDVVFAGGLHVDGRIIGRIMAEADAAAFLSISEHGYVEGDISVPTIVVNGEVNGNVHASDKITLAPKARVSGNLYYKSMEMQAGAKVNGQVLHDVAAQAKLAQKPESAARADGHLTDLRELRQSRS
jgi:cytoskeletal protein CcmA (bactofilin family)